MSIKIIVNEKKEEEEKDIFKVNNYVVNRYCIVHVTKNKRTSPQTGKDIFEEVVVKVIKIGDGDYEGDIIDNWICSRFKQFKGKITIEVK